jgi:glutathione S-transferase
MKEIDFAYLPIIGRGEQIHIICAMHKIKLNMLNSTPMGNDFQLNSDSLFGTVPWMKDKSNGLVLNDSMAMVQYLVNEYSGPLTPSSTQNSAAIANLWAWSNDYYSYVLSPLHDIITGHSDAFWRNLRLTDTLAEGGKELALNNLKVLHDKRVNFLEAHLKKESGGNFMVTESCTYADIFLYTCVRAVQKCAGFSEFRNFYGSDPFSNSKKIESVCRAVESIKIVSDTVGTKFDECPI